MHALALGMAASVMLTGCTGATSARSLTARPVTTASGPVVRTFPIAAPGARVIAAAAPGGVLYAAVTGGDEANWTVSRLDAASGAVVSRDLHLPQLQTLTVGLDGIYAATSMIDRYGTKPDTILRLDPATLSTLATRHLDDGALWDGGVRLVPAGSDLVEMDGGGAVRLLDPHSLATKASVQILSRSEEEGGDFIDNPVVHHGRLWVTAAHRMRAFRLPDLRPVASIPEGGFRSIVDTEDGPVLVGTRLARLGDDGGVTVLPQLTGVDAESGPNAAAGLGELIAEQPDGDPARVVVRRLDGSVLRTVALDADDGVLLAGADGLLWVQGAPDTGSSVSAIRAGAAT